MDLYRPDVVAGKYDPTQFDPHGLLLLINEVFYSLQGEGRHAGTAAVFVRLSKCNLACKFCDTEFETNERIPFLEVVNRVKSSHARHGSRPTVYSPGLPLVILTGGEPALQNCSPLIRALHDEGYQVAMETSGSVNPTWLSSVDHVCVSPKVPLARIPEPLLEVAEFKWIVNAAFLNMYERDPESVFNPRSLNYLQPESLNPKWTTAASKLVMRHPGRYKLSLQTHKLAGNP